MTGITPYPLNSFRERLILNIHFIFTWVMFLGLFPISYFWLRRAWRIIRLKDYSYVALKKGEPPKNPEKYAPYSGGINLIAGLIFASVIILIIAAALPYETWSAIVGVTLWMKIFADFIISRLAHFKKK